MVDADADNRFGGRLEVALLDSLRVENPQGHNDRIALAVYDRDGRLAAGLQSTTSYGWLHVTMLWVAPAARGAGLAKALMARAFARAGLLGCHACWLETSSPSALAFYRHLGFEEFARLENGPEAAPPGHRRWFLRRDLNSL